MQIVKNKRFVAYSNEEVTQLKPHPDKIYVFDLDGTMCNIKHRLHHILVDRSKGEKKNFPEFYRAVPNDLPIEEIVALNQVLPAENIYLITGRSMECVDDTKELLAKHGIRWSRLYMRWHHNFEHDVDLKRHMADEFIENIIFAIDDRPRIVEMWRENNVPCIAMPWDQEIGTVSKRLGEKKESVA